VHDRWLQRGRRTHKLVFPPSRPRALLEGACRSATLWESVDEREVLALFLAAESLRRQGPHAPRHRARGREAPAFAGAHQRNKPKRSTRMTALDRRATRRVTLTTAPNTKGPPHSRHGPKGTDAAIVQLYRPSADRSLPRMARLYVGFGAGSRVSRIEAMRTQAQTKSTLLIANAERNVDTGRAFSGRLQMS